MRPFLPSRGSAVTVQIRDALEAMLGLSHAVGTVGIAAGEITDAEVITLNDGETERVMEFLDNLTGAAEEVRLVTIGTMVDVTAPVSAASDYALQADMHNGDRVWYSPTKGLYVYWDGTDSWVLYGNKGVDAPTNFWKRTNADPVGEFTHQGTYTGDPDFSLADVPATILANLIAAINVGQIDPTTIGGQGHAGLWAEDITVGAGEATLRITSALAGTAGNVTITTDSTCAVDGMAGGVDGESPFAGERLVAISDHDGDTQAVANEWSAVDLTAALAPDVVAVIVSVNEPTCIVPTVAVGDPSAGNVLVGEQFRANLNLRIPATGCRYIHYQAVNPANQAVIFISAVVRTR